jgi:murein L,D-transpeptidase YcbB/YkuD
LNKKLTIFYTILASLWMMLPLPASSNPLTLSPENYLRSRLLAPESTLSTETENTVDARSTLIRFYEKYNYHLIWFSDRGIEPQGEFLLEVIDNAAQDGLNPAEYQIFRLEPTIPTIKHCSNGAPAGPMHRIALLDIAFTQAFIRYTSDLQHGRLHAEGFELKKRSQTPFSPEITAARLKTAITQGDLAKFFEELAPRHTAYDTLKKHLQRYETIKLIGGWPLIPSGPVLKLGVRSPRVPLLRQRLLITGDLCLSQFSSQERFGESLERAVIRYQHRNGIKADGIVGRNTLECLNIPIEERITQIKVNMERWRWLPPDLGPRHLMVNIPGFELNIIQNNAIQDSMRVIVGRKKRQTPILSSNMTYLELNPYWNIPSTIARKDILPKIQDDPLYLVNNDIRVLTGWKRNSPMLDPLGIDWQKFSSQYLPYRFRQDPSPSNALGQVKFMFPNHHSIYIHDTPAKALFRKEVRSFSSGCIRVQHPLKLARLLLSNQQWDGRRITDAVGTQKRRVIVMSPPMPVHLVYFTAWPDENDHTLNFGKDIYGRDRRLVKALGRKPSQTLWCGATRHLCGSPAPMINGSVRCPDSTGHQAIAPPDRAHQKI